MPWTTIDEFDVVPKTQRTSLTQDGILCKKILIIFKVFFELSCIMYMHTDGKTGNHCRLIKCDYLSNNNNQFMME